MKEVWKDVKGFEGVYQVSNTGKVKSLDRYVHWYGTEVFRKGVVLTATIVNPGYPMVTLIHSNTKSRKKERVHRIVAKAFLPNPNNLETVNHIDGDKTNNHVSNLEWLSYASNNLHAQKTGLNNMWKLSFSIAQDIREERKKGTKVSHLCKKYNVSESTIYSVINNKTWRLNE